MGQLVFQAALGGQVNLVGPNTASTLNINVPAFAGTMASLATVTNNGVTYVNSSGQPTTGTGFVFDGTNVGIGNTTVRNKLDVVGNTGIYSTGATSVGSPLGAQVYIGDSNYNTTSYYNAAPGFGAVYDATYASAAALAFYTYAGTPNARSERMRIDASGNVGIGTSSPSNTLQVSGTSYTTGKTYIGNNTNFTNIGNLGWSPAFIVEDTNGQGIAAVRNTADAYGGSINLVKSRGTLASPSAVTSGDRLGQLYFNGYDSVDYSNTGASIEAIANATWTSNSCPTDLVFSTTTSGSFTASERMRIDSSGNVGIGTSSPSTYGAKLAIYSAASSTANIQITNPGIGTGTIGLTAASSNFKIYNSYASGTLAGGAGIDIDTSGNVGINTTTTTRARLNIDTDGTNTSAGYGLALTNTAGGGATWTLQCGDQAINNGAFTIRQTGISGTTWFKIEATTGYITVQGVYNLTTASAANVFVGTGGDLRRSTSSLKYKTDVQDATYGLAEVMVLRPVTYKGKNDGDTIFGGLIAEEVDAAGLTEFVQYADDGTPDALAYGNMVSLCIKAIQEQQALITALTARITALESK